MGENVIKSIGVCPVCGKGQIVLGSLGYSCNYFKNMQDKCSFNIYHTYWGKAITEDIAKQLIETGESEVFNDLQRKDGQMFSASLVIQDGKVVPKFANECVSGCCPKCGKKVEILLSGYACEDYKNGCDFFIPKAIAHREIPIQAIEALLSSKETPFMSGFQKNNGEEFQAKLILREDGTVGFDNTVCKCPKCGGKIFMNKKAYNCSNFRDENIHCNFVIWKEMSGRTITPEDAKTLCEEKETAVLAGFRDKDGNEMQRKLILNEDFNVKLV